MSVFTNFLNLFKWEPNKDSEEEFDIDKALNENWDKIDNKYNELSTKENSNQATINNHIQDNENPHQVTKQQLGLEDALLKTDDIKQNVATFTESSERNNIESGMTVSVILGRIKRYFSDLKTVAFSGSYNDLTDKPDIAGATILRKIIVLENIIEKNTNYTLEMSYQVGNSLEVYYCGNKLLKGQDYTEIGNEGEISNTIQFLDTIGDLDMSDVEGFEDFEETLEFIVRGDYSANT